MSPPEHTKERRYIDEVLSIADGHLWIEGCDTVDIASQYGTPLYVMSETQLRANCRQLGEVFERYWCVGPVELLPSLKANYVMAVRQILNAEGLGCDVFGHGELQAALWSGVPSDKISVNGSAKSAPLIELAVSVGARITLDSERELDLVIAAAERQQKSANVRLRVRPDYLDLTVASDFFPTMTIRDAANIYKPGIEVSAAVRVGRRVLHHPNTQLTGLMTHLGRHSADPAVWATMARTFGSVVVQLADAWAPWRPLELDIGGGFPAPRDPSNPARLAAPPLECFAQSTTGALLDALHAGRMDPAGVVLQIEPGRSLLANAGIHLSRVCHVKRQDRPVPRTWIELDTTEMFLADLFMEHAYFRPVFASQADAPCLEKVEIVGQSCNFDLLARDVEAPAIASGDVIAFLDTGAYQDAAASNFNALARPATVLVTENRCTLIKRRETLEEIFARDLPLSRNSRIE
ncbi:MAG: diaminopimelate decarboxylase family protein [Steroidobacteraceae bacterium]